MSEQVYSLPEMSLHDFFAGCALCGILADPSIDFTLGNGATLAYSQADAMLAAREEQSDDG